MLPVAPPMGKKIASTGARLTLKFWPWLLLIPLGVAAASYPRTVHLYRNISTDPLDLLPKDHPNVVTLQKVRAKTENRTRIGIVLESDDPDKTLAYLEGLASRLADQPFVRRVITRKLGYDFFNKYKLLFIDLEDLQTIRDRIHRRIQQEKLKGLLLDLEEEEELNFEDLDQKYRNQYSGAVRSEYFVSEDGRIYSFYVEPKDPGLALKSASQFYDQIDAFLKTERPKGFEPTLKVYLAGTAKVLEYRALIRDLKLAGLISGVALFLPLLIRFRSLTAALLIFAPLGLGIPIAFAFASFFIEKLSIITSFLFAILGGLGVESGVHIFTHYHTRRSLGATREDALEETYGPVLRTILTSVASVAITFLLLVVSHFRGFSEFGFISGIGLWILFLLYFLFFPPLLLFAEKVRLIHFRPLGELPVPRGTIPGGWYRPGLLLALLLSLYSLMSPFLLQFEYDSRKVRADIPEVRTAKEKQKLTSTRLNNPAVVIVNSREEAELLKVAFKERKGRDPSTPTIDTTRSYYDLVPSDQREKLAVIQDIKKMLTDPTVRLVKGERKKDLDRFREALDQAEPFTEAAVPSEVRELFVGREDLPGTLFFINALPDMELDDGRNAIRFAEDVAQVQTPLGDYFPSSDANIFGMMLMTMFADAPKILLLSLGSVIFFVFLDFRSVKKTGLVVASILMGVFWLLGLMHLFGIKFNLYNMVTLPTVMGVSIDNAIHVMHHYQTLGRGSLRKVLSTTGIACLVASLTNAAGFAGLLFTIHRGLYSIGLVAVLGIGTCLLATLAFLPLLLSFLESRQHP